MIRMIFHFSGGLNLEKEKTLWQSNQFPRVTTR